MLNQITTIVDLIVASFVHTWPYLLLTIPLAVAVRMSGASRYISRAFRARPLLAIFLATAVGAFSPFCSCGVVPIVAALLISGVPLAPVMSFWIASPSMDPEIFFLSVATIGWELAVWRLAATLVLSLGAGFITHFVVQRGWLGQQLLRARQSGSAGSAWDRLRASWRGLQEALRALPLLGSRPTAAACCAAAEPVSTESRQFALAAVPVTAAGGSASCALDEAGSYSSGQAGSCNSGQASSCSSGQGGSCRGEADSFWRRLLAETWDATAMVVKFMLLAFFLSALIKLYVPEEWVAGLLGRHNPWAIPFAAFLGVPAYASNLTALPMLDGLLAQGMSPSAALAFLIAGPTTTIPAMAAVWGLTSRRVFALYVSFSLVGAVVLGYAHSLLAGLF